MNFRPRHKGKSLMSKDSTRKETDYAIKRLEAEFNAKTELLISNANAELGRVSERSIASALSLLRQSAVVVGVAIGLIGFFGFDNIRGMVINNFDNKIDKWLRFESPSPFESRLLDIRDRHLLDSMYLQYIRSKSGNSYRPQYEISKTAKKELVRIANDKDTSLQDYSDILDILADRLDPVFPSSASGFQLVKVFKEEGFKHQYEKQREFLDAFKSDRMLGNLAVSLLEDESPHKLQAYTIVANNYRDYAVKYSNKKLLGLEIDFFSLELAKTLAIHDPGSKILHQYLTKIYKSKGRFDGWIHHYITLADLIISNDFNDDVGTKSFFKPVNLSDKGSRKDMALMMFEVLLADGFSFDIEKSMGLGNLIITNGKNKSYLVRSEFEAFFDKNDMVSEIFKESILRGQLYSVVNMFTVYGEEEDVLVSVNLKAGPNFKITAADGNVYTSSEINSRIWVRANGDSSEKRVVASFINDVGSYSEVIIKDVMGYEDMKVNLNFNKTTVIRHINEW